MHLRKTVCPYDKRVDTLSHVLYTTISVAMGKK